MDELQAKIARNIRELLRFAGARQNELAAHLGVDASGMSKRFSGKIPLGIPELRKAADFLRVDPQVLLYDADEFTDWLRSSTWLIDLRDAPIGATSSTSDLGNRRSTWNECVESDVLALAAI